MKRGQISVLYLLYYSIGSEETEIGNIHVTHGPGGLKEEELKTIIEAATHCSPVYNYSIILRSIEYSSI